jgi:hypothetical protein
VIQVAANRYNPGGGTVPKIAVVVHTSEGWEGVGRVQQLLDALVSVGTTPHGVHFIGAAYNAVATPGGFEEVLPDTDAPFSAPPWNPCAAHICITGKAAQTRDEWLDDVSRPLIRGVAEYIWAMHLKHGIPLHRLTVDEMKKAGVHPSEPIGYCGHVDVAHAYGQTTHTDPGPNFPWDVLAADIDALAVAAALDNLENDDMKLYITYWQKDPVGGYIVTDLLTWRRVTNQAELATLKTAGAVDQTSGPGLPMTSTLYGK